MKKILTSILFAIMPTLLVAQNEQKLALNVVFIGNSITQGAQLKDPLSESPPAQCGKWLQMQTGIATATVFNKGVSGSTTVDFLPASHTLLLKVEHIADSLALQTEKTLLFSVMLGTNDSASKGPNGAPVSAPQYFTNIKVIVDELLSRYPQSLVVLHRPIWYSPNTHNGAIYLKDGLNRLVSYFPQLQTLVNDYSMTRPDRVFMGDTDAFDYFQSNYLTDFNPEQGHAGTFYLHPNGKGATQLGESWGKAIYRVFHSKGL